MKTLAFCLLIDIFITVEAWPCSSPISKVYSRVNSNAVLQFSADLTNLDSPRKFEIKFYDGSIKARITYNPDKNPTIEALSGASITGSTNGTVVVTLDNVQENNAGIYSMTSAGFSQICNCLYMLGIPTKPNITLKQMPFVGENATFTCNSKSTTMPSNHSLTSTYTWIVNGVNMHEGERYSYASNKMTITNVVKGDVDRQFRCSVREHHSLGYTSKESEIFSFDVYYGPGVATINVDSPYHITDGEVSKKIACTSTCKPGCTYKWTHIPSGLSAGVNGLLFLNPANRTVAGGYKCTIRNTAALNTKYVSKNVNIIVNYPPTVTIRSSETDIKEGHEMTLFCEGHGVPSDNTYISFSQTFNKVNIPNKNTALNGTDRFSSIHFPSLSFQDTGTYTCVLNNGIKNKNGELDQSGSKDIFVEALPKILTDDLRFTGSTEGIGRIKISIYSYPALIQVTLLRHDQNVLSSDKKYVSEGIVRTLFYGKDVSLNGSFFEFDIHDLKKDDFGNYTLNVKNSIGTTKTIISLIAEGKPSPPTAFQYLPGKNIPSFIWEKTFNGGLEQSFIIQTSVAGTNIWTNRTLILESDEKYQINDTYFSTEVHGLEPGIYTARLISKNLKGESDIVELGKTFEVFKPTENQQQIAAIVGGCVAATVVLLVGLIVLIMFRRAKQMGGTKPKSKKARSRNDGLNMDKNDEESEVNTVNPMNVSADDMPDNTYAQPVKTKKAPEAGDVYAVVNKKTMHDKKEKRNVHAKKAEQDIPTQSKRLVNKDGLIYADLTFNDAQMVQKNIILGNLDSMTEYVEVDFSKKADPLPDSDDDNHKANT